MQDFDFDSPIPSIEFLAREVNFVSRICFVSQLILGIIPSISFVILVINQKINPYQSAVNFGVGWALGFLSLIGLGFSIFWWTRIKKLPPKLRDTQRRPPRREVIQDLKTGLIVNLGGMVCLGISSLIYIWVLMVKVMVIPARGVSIQSNALVPLQVITSLDIISLLAIIHTIAAELLGVLGYLWLANRVINFHSER